MRLPRTLFCFILLLVLIGCGNGDTGIERYSLVTRHNIDHSDTDVFNSLSVGNGKFAFTADITGLQTFPLRYADGVPLGTMSEWGWHSFRNPEGYTLTDVIKYYEVGDDLVPYYYMFPEGENTRESKATAWLRENPHRLHLGMVGLDIRKSDGSLITIEDVSNPRQQLNLWTGELTSYFEIEGVPVKVVTLSDQDEDRVAVHIESSLIESNQLAINVSFPYSRHEKFNSGYDFTRPDEHHSEIILLEDNSCLIGRQLGEESYFARVDWEGVAGIREASPHTYLLEPTGASDQLTFGVLFSPENVEYQYFDFDRIRSVNRETWNYFWNSGGAVDFSGSTDPRAFELERRVVLSQYLTRIQCGGIYPPQETGLTYSSWHGKFHLEMHWWHGFHFILWQRAHLMEEQLDYYYAIKDKARETAELQGYEGVRWQKMIDPSGRESPSDIGVFLIWQQPHIINFAELLYRTGNQDAEVLEKFTPLVYETAEFMASYARYVPERDEYILGPALIPAQERFPPEETINPAFELAYWYWGLETAQKWRERNGLERNTEWQEVIDKLSPLPVQDGLYLFTETAPDSYSNDEYLTDHPMVLGLLGMLPETPMVDRKILNNTLDAILEKWHWETCWGWDFPMAAMNAAALDRQELAVDLLLMETVKNRYLLNGHNYQDDDLALYLPGNGGILTAVAMMCTHRNDEGENGFPSDGTWDVKYENLFEMY